MITKKILITGGAGFIGQHLARKLIKKGDEVRILDSFNPQVHKHDHLPTDLSDHVTLYKADIRDKEVLKKALTGVDTVVHFAAETGTGQSMYAIDHYFDVNVQGTAILLDLLQNDHCGQEVKTLVVASSRAIYGEGAYTCNTHGTIYPASRDPILMQKGEFDPHCPHCQRKLQLALTDENTLINPLSFYGITKYMQEASILLFAKQQGINAFALRYQNVYGPGQSLKNPYTGILAVFSNLARVNAKINVFEDGLESRDFVYIDDVIDATIKSIDYEKSFIGTLNVGSGKSSSVISIAEKIKTFFKSQSAIEVSGDYRQGDIRHNIADIRKIKSLLNFSPSISIDDGLKQFLEWALSQPEETIKSYEHSIKELEQKNLLFKMR